MGEGELTAEHDLRLGPAARLYEKGGLRAVADACELEAGGEAGAAVAGQFCCGRVQAEGLCQRRVDAHGGSRWAVWSEVSCCSLWVILLRFELMGVLVRGEV